MSPSCRPRLLGPVTLLVELAPLLLVGLVVRTLVSKVLVLLVLVAGVGGRSVTSSTSTGYQSARPPTCDEMAGSRESGARENGSSCAQPLQQQAKLTLQVSCHL